MSKSQIFALGLVGLILSLVVGVSASRLEYKANKAMSEPSFKEKCEASGGKAIVFESGIVTDTYRCVHVK